MTVARGPAGGSPQRLPRDRVLQHPEHPPQRLLGDDGARSMPLPSSRPARPAPRYRPIGVPAAA